MKQEKSPILLKTTTESILDPWGKIEWEKLGLVAEMDEQPSRISNQGNVGNRILMELAYE
jgi:hypothetical protein